MGLITQLRPYLKDEIAIVSTNSYRIGLSLLVRLIEVNCSFLKENAILRKSLKNKHREINKYPVAES
jgi:hypothetical protein